MIRHIALSGNIGSGKTTLAKELSKHFGWEVMLESVDDNPYLEDFYYNMKKWAYKLQIYFLFNRYEQVKNIQLSKIPVVQDRTLYEDADIFAKHLHSSGDISHSNYQKYLREYERVVENAPPPDLLIYLRSDVSNLVRRINIRNRDYESRISIQYLNDLNLLYEQWIARYDLGKLLIIDSDKYDYVNEASHLATVLEMVNRELFGIFK
jgi:deoxyadenosine/deoxycytidine kinase